MAGKEIPVCLEDAASVNGVVICYSNQIHAATLKFQVDLKRVVIRLATYRERPGTVHIPEWIV
jgi:hypothetical protein